VERAGGGEGEVGGAGQRRLGRRVIGVEELVGLVVVLGAFAVAADVSRRGEEECELKLKNGIFQCCFFVELNKTNGVKFWFAIYSCFDVSMIMVIIIKKNKYLKKSQRIIK